MFHIGIDVSKKKLDICLLLDGISGKRKTKVLSNDTHAVPQLISWLGKQKCQPKKVRIVLEATGTYHDLLCDQLVDAGIYLSIVNPYRIREFARGMGVLTKNDTVDAYALTCFSTLKQPTAWEPPPPEVRELKSLLCRRKALLSDVLSERNRLEKAEATKTPKVVMHSMHECTEDPGEREKRNRSGDSQTH